MSTHVQKLFDLRARPPSSPAARAASACRWPRRSAKPAPRDADLAQGRRPRGGGGASCRAPASTRAGSPPTAASRTRSPRLAEDAWSASATSTSWSTTPARAGARPAEDHPLEAWDKVMNLNVRSIFLMSQAIGKHSMIPRKAGKHHQRRVDRRPGRQQRRDDDGGLQHVQGRGDQLHAHAGRRMGQVQHQRQRDLPRACSRAR